MAPAIKAELLECGKVSASLDSEVCSCFSYSVTLITKIVLSQRCGLMLSCVFLLIDFPFEIDMQGLRKAGSGG